MKNKNVFLTVLNTMTFREINDLLTGKEAFLFSEEGKEFIRVFINSKKDNMKASLETFKRIIRDKNSEPYISSYTDRIKKLERMLNS
jgi:ribosomal protein L10